MENLPGVWTPASGAAVTTPIRAVVMVTPEDQAGVIAEQAFVDEMEEIHNETSTVLEVLPLKGWTVGSSPGPP
jgi:hypothetical protein